MKRKRAPSIIPQFCNENGEVIKNSIAEKCYLEVEDGNLGMIIVGKDIRNPVLLVCGGGPGIPKYLMEYRYPSGLADKFVVSYLEYRGTGLLYNSDIKAEEMTMEKYISDVVAVSKYLSERFRQEKIYIMGHSFGTYIAIKTVQRYLDYYHAYIAMAQTCNQTESEYMANDFMKAQYKYYEQIDAPIKEFYVFHNSAHSPIFEELEAASKLVEEILEVESYKI